MADVVLQHFFHCFILNVSSLPAPPQALYQSWVLDATRNILAILEDMPSLKPPIDHLCELLPRLQARYYSIASSSKVLLYLNHRGKKFKAYFNILYCCVVD